MHQELIVGAANANEKFGLFNETALRVVNDFVEARIGNRANGSAKSVTPVTGCSFSSIDLTLWRTLYRYVGIFILSILRYR